MIFKPSTANSYPLFCPLFHQHLATVAIGSIMAFSAAAVSAQTSAQQPTPGPSSGQATEQPSAAPSASPAPQTRTATQPSKAEIAARFNSADINADGKLTKEEARTSMPGVFDNFERVDTKAQGFITVQDLTLAMGR